LTAVRVRTIPQRELRNNVSAILREAEAGTHFVITVHGRPVARLVPFVASPDAHDDVRRTDEAAGLHGTGE
jgi:prevent-host-death family protein